MFETVRARWNQYLSRVSGSWREDDVRRNLAAEVQNRLRQLDLMLRHLRDAIEVFTPNPYEIAQAGHETRERITLDQLLAYGEITYFEDLKRIHEMVTSEPPRVGWIDAWDDIAIFTEAF